MSSIVDESAASAAADAVSINTDCAQTQNINQNPNYSPVSNSMNDLIGYLENEMIKTVGGSTLKKNYVFFLTK